MIKISIIIRILVILGTAFIDETFEISTISVQYTEFSINDYQNSNNSVPCNKSCAICGQNSISCTFISYKCEIKCNCYPGFNGSKCEYLVPNNQYFTKDDLWSIIHGQIVILSPKQVLENMINLVNNFKIFINEFDVFNTYLILQSLIENNKLIFSTDAIELLFNYIDLLISCNYLNNNTNNSIFLNANLLYNMSAIGVLNLVDQITTKYANSNNSNIYLLMKLEKFQVLVSTFNLFNTVNNTRLVETIPSKNNDFSIEMDSISLNETILKREFKNDTLKIILKIFYTLQKNENQTLTLESNETSFSLKSNLFFDLSHPAAQVEYNEPYIISSTILSAILIHKLKTVHNFSNIYRYEKFVRIQFTVVSKSAGFEKNLKCVYWDDNRLNWATSGCYKSRTESIFIINNKFYRQVCYCNHLTNFALLFDPNPFSTLTNDELIDDLIFNYVLSIMSYTGIIISLVCYFIMIVTRLFSAEIQNAKDKNSRFYKNMFSFPFKILSFGDFNQVSSQSNSSSNQLSQNLSKPKKRCDYILRCLYLANIISLFLANISFIVLTFIKRHDNSVVCNVVGLSLQYLLLASFCFSLGIAYQHFIKLVLVFSISYNKKKFVVKWFLASLLIPIPFVFIAYFYDFKNNDSEFCWLSKPYLYYLFVVPVVCLLLISFTFYIICVMKICNTYCKCKLFEQDRIIDFTSSYNHKYVLSLLLFSMLSLSLTWLIGILIVISSKMNNKVFNYLSEFFFCLFNSFHGISLLIAQYMAQKYSFNKSHYQLKETKSNSSSSALTVSSLSPQQSENKKQTCKFFTDIFSKDFKKSNSSKQVQEIKLYNCIHVNNYNYTSTPSNTPGSNNIDKNSTTNYSFYHNNVNYIINSQDDRNSTINIDYFINFNNINRKTNIINKNGCYVVSLDAFTSSI